MADEMIDKLADVDGKQPVREKPDDWGAENQDAVDWEAEANDRAKRQRRRLIQVGVLLFCPLLLHSCGLSEITMSLGPIAPVAVFDMNTDDLWPEGIKSFSAIGLVMNIAFAVALCYVAAIPKARDVMVSKSFRYTLWLFLFASNCVLVCRFLPFLAYVWHYSILYPLTTIMQFIRPATEQASLLFRRPGESDPFDVEVVAFAISSRFYYALVLLVGTTSPRLLRWFHRYVLQASPDRWWQFSLRGWFALTLIIGLLTSLIVWIAQQ